ncbi:hypothetical protein OFC49_38940, partial [Escherichia coli]|nr:hypothetical protein [Escherichia coli]
MKFNGLSKISLSSTLSKKKPSFGSLITHFKYLNSVGIQMGVPLKSSVKYRLRDVFRVFNKKRINKLYSNEVKF